MKKILFFTKSVSIPGGKEKVVAGLANYLAGEGYSIKIITYDSSTNSFFYLHQSILVESLPLRSANPSTNFFTKFLDIRKDINIYKYYRKETSEALVIIATDYLVASTLMLGNKSCAKKLI